jgi:hypothetical protein
MLRRQEVVGADDLAREQRPDALDPVRVQDVVAQPVTRYTVAPLARSADNPVLNRGRPQYA